MQTAVFEERRRALPAAIDVIPLYKEEFFDLYGELLTAILELEKKCSFDAVDAFCKRVTEKVMQVRTAFLSGIDTHFEWLSLCTRMILLKRLAEESGYNEVALRAEMLGLRAMTIAEKVKRSNVHAGQN